MRTDPCLVPALCACIPTFFLTAQNTEFDILRCMQRELESSARYTEMHAEMHASSAGMQYKRAQQAVLECMQERAETD